MDKHTHRSINSTQSRSLNIDASAIQLFMFTEVEPPNSSILQNIFCTYITLLHIGVLALNMSEENIHIIKVQWLSKSSNTTV